MRDCHVYAQPPCVPATAARDRRRARGRWEAECEACGRVKALAAAVRDRLGAGGMAGGRGDERGELRGAAAAGGRYGAVQRAAAGRDGGGRCGAATAHGRDGGAGRGAVATSVEWAQPEGWDWERAEGVAEPWVPATERAAALEASVEAGVRCLSLGLGP